MVQLVEALWYKLEGLQLRFPMVSVPVQASTGIAKTLVLTILMKILVVWSVDGLFG